jgi:hypothetical protein
MLMILILLLIVLFSIRMDQEQDQDQEQESNRKPVASHHQPFTIPNHSPNARVVKWQTRTFEGRMPQGMGVQVPPRAPTAAPL